MQRHPHLQQHQQQQQQQQQQGYNPDLQYQPTAADNTSYSSSASSAYASRGDFKASAVPGGNGATSGRLPLGAGDYKATPAYEDRTPGNVYPKLTSDAIGTTAPSPFRLQRAPESTITQSGTLPPLPYYAAAAAAQQEAARLRRQQELDDAERRKQAAAAAVAARSQQQQQLLQRSPVVERKATTLEQVTAASTVSAPTAGSAIAEGPLGASAPKTNVRMSIGAIAPGDDQMQSNGLFLAAYVQPLACAVTEIKQTRLMHATAVTSAATAASAEDAASVGGLRCTNKRCRAYANPYWKLSPSRKKAHCNMCRTDVAIHPDVFGSDQQTPAELQFTDVEFVSVLPRSFEQRRFQCHVIVLDIATFWDDPAGFAHEIETPASGVTESAPSESAPPSHSRKQFDTIVHALKLMLKHVETSEPFGTFASVVTINSRLNQASLFRLAAGDTRVCEDVVAGLVGEDYSPFLARPAKDYRLRADWFSARLHSKIDKDGKKIKETVLETVLRLTERNIARGGSRSGGAVDMRAAMYAGASLAFQIAADTGGRVLYVGATDRQSGWDSKTAADATADAASAVSAEDAAVIKAYRSLGEQCTEFGVSVDAFLLHASPATAGMNSCAPLFEMTGGHIHMIAPGEETFLLAGMIVNKVRGTGRDATMTIRCSPGLAPTEFYGNSVFGRRIQRRGGDEMQWYASGPVCDTSPSAPAAEDASPVILFGSIGSERNVCVFFGHDRVPKMREPPAASPGGGGKIEAKTGAAVTSAADAAVEWQDVELKGPAAYVQFCVTYMDVKTQTFRRRVMTREIKIASKLKDITDSVDPDILYTALFRKALCQSACAASRTLIDETCTRIIGAYQAFLNQRDSRQLILPDTLTDLALLSLSALKHPVFADTSASDAITGIAMSREERAYLRLQVMAATPGITRLVMRPVLYDLFAAAPSAPLRPDDASGEAMAAHFVKGPLPLRFDQLFGYRRVMFLYDGLRMMLWIANDNDPDVIDRLCKALQATTIEEKTASMQNMYAMLADAINHVKVFISQIKSAQAALLRPSPIVTIPLQCIRQSMHNQHGSRPSIDELRFYQLMIDEDAVDRDQKRTSPVFMAYKSYLRHVSETIARRTVVREKEKS